MTLVYVIGVPGVGKSTAVAAATSHYTPIPIGGAVPHRLLTTPNGQPAAILLGTDHPIFPGTDRLSMAILPTACQWITHIPPDFPVIGEGDRLAHPRFWQAAAAAGHPVHVYNATEPPHVIETRRATRNTHQNGSWLTGRTTRNRNLTTQWPCHDTPTADLPRHLARHLPPDHHNMDTCADCLTWIAGRGTLDWTAQQRQEALTEEHDRHTV